jgi:hypothetical protein
METFTMDPGSSKLSLAALLAVKPAGALEGNFRLVLTSTENTNVRLPITEFIPHKAMEGFTMVGQFQPEGQIVMQLNSMATSGWTSGSWWPPKTWTSWTTKRRRPLKPS